MKYMGSKNRIAKYILPIITKDRSDGQYFYDVFCGGGNIIDKVKNPRVGIDNNRYLIEALRLIRDNPKSLPKNKNDFCEDDYKLLKMCKIHRLKGYCGFALSYGGKWFGGVCRDGQGKRDYISEAYRNALKQSGRLQGASFECSDYRNYYFNPKSIIYCDPPYRNTTKYCSSFFNHEVFWEWIRGKKVEGHSVFVSEYSAPVDFQCIWKKEINSSLTKDTGSKKGVEKLFTYII